MITPSDDTVAVDVGELAELPRVETSIGAAATAYLARGWMPIPVFSPAAKCAAPGKQPKAKNWQRRGFVPADFAEGDNIGLRMGGPARLVALDVDGEEGRASLAELEDAHGKLPETLTAKTGRDGGGTHLVFRVPESWDIGSIKNRAGQIAPGLDVRGEGGQIVVCPSRHPSGNLYEWVRPVAPAELPEWLFDLAVGLTENRGRPADPAASQPIALDNEAIQAKREALVMDRLVARANALRDAPQGQRNGALNKAAYWAGRYVGGHLLDRVEVERVLTEAARRAGLGDGEIRSTLRSGLDAGMLKPETSISEKKRDKASRLISYVNEAEPDLFHSPDGRGFATLDDGRTIALSSREFCRWLTQIFWAQEGGSPGSEAIKDVVSHFEALAINGRPEHEVFVRIASAGDSVFLDLGGPDREVVKITAAGWELLKAPPEVRFVRPQGLRALPVPTQRGALAPLWNLINLGSGKDAERAKALIAAWLVGTLHPSGPYPLLLLRGEQGSGKSGAGRVLRSIVDPNAAGLRSPPGDDRDLALAASNAWIVGFDNLSRVPEWLSDALCRVTTGGGFATRTLYADREETIFDYKRPVLVTAIDLSLRPDLLSRALLVTLPTIPPESRKTERELEAVLEVALPAILGALLDAAAVALGRYKSITLSRMPRLADFAVWATAAEPALGLPSGAIEDALSSNGSEAAVVGLESSPIFEGLSAALTAPWAGTATELLEACRVALQNRPRLPDGFPRNGRGMSHEVTRIAPALRSCGWNVEPPRGHSQGRIWRFTPPSESASSAYTNRTMGSAATADPHSPSVERDGRDGENTVAEEFSL